MSGRIVFSSHKKNICEFVAETLEFARQDGGLLLTASGEMVFQDTAPIENLLHENATCHVTIFKDEAEVMNGQFHTVFFALEPDTLVVLLH